MAQVQEHQNRIQEILDDSHNFRSARLSERTIKRLQSRAKYKDTYDSIINKILDQLEGKKQGMD